MAIPYQPVVLTVTGDGGNRPESDQYFTTGAGHLRYPNSAHVAGWHYV